MHFGGDRIYIYPDNLNAKATLWLWQLRDLAIIGIGLLIAVLALTQLKAEKNGFHTTRAVLSDVGTATENML